MITVSRPITHASLPGVTVFPLGQIGRGVSQEVLVQVAPGVTIPKHEHDVDAEMHIVFGSGRVISDDPATDGVDVSAGACVFFEKKKGHGFHAGPGGLSFVSKNGGIVDETGNWDMKFVQ